METKPASAFDLLADAFDYPQPGQLAALEAELENLTAEQFSTGQRQALVSFLGHIRTLKLGEWEELHTRTLDLNPPAAPYVGFQTWGESYQRGEFMAAMSRELTVAGVDTDGELPDHLAPVLRYLGRSAAPLPELLRVLDPAILRILATLRSADPSNPYIHLLEAVQDLCSGLKKETV
jgi:nitrate reductase delta subunit